MQKNFTLTYFSLLIDDRSDGESEQDLKLDLHNSGRLKVDALLQHKTLRGTKLEQVPEKSTTYWSQLDKTLNEKVLLQVLTKDAVDEDDRVTLEALGILQLWVFFKHPSKIPAWTPIMACISRCEEAAKQVIKYLVSTSPRKEDPTDAKDYLLQHFAYITPSTVWALQQATFWKLPSMSLVILKATFTIFDPFN